MKPHPLFLVCAAIVGTQMAACGSDDTDSSASPPGIGGSADGGAGASGSPDASAHGGSAGTAGMAGHGGGIAGGAGSDASPPDAVVDAPSPPVHQAASCQPADVLAAISLAAAGDIVAVPAGNCTWATADGLTLSTSITLQGSGADATNITIGEGNGWAGVLTIDAPSVTVRGFSFHNETQSYPVAVGPQGADFRVTDCMFTGTAYGIHVLQAYGLIDNNTFAGTGGEFIQTIGPCDSWQTDDSFGGAENVFIENNQLTGGGYITCNADARCVFRYNTSTGGQFFEAHQKCTNTNYCSSGDTHRGPRQSEVYNNLWETSANYFDFTDIYGGTARVYNNLILVSAYLWLSLGEYTAMQSSGCYDYSACNCTWPAMDQVGVGKDPLVGASDPVFIWNNMMGPDRQNLSLVVAGVLNNEVPQCAVDGQCGAGFTMSTIVAEGRDYFQSVTKPDAVAGYEPYACPHPRAGLAGSCDPNTAGRDGYPTQ